MTQAELDALPETGLFGAEERIIDGKLVRVPVLQDAGVLWTEEDEPCMVRDVYGDYWRIGLAADGKRYKRRDEPPPI